MVEHKFHKGIILQKLYIPKSKNDSTIDKN